jgi:hypothetical protein
VGDPEAGAEAGEEAPVAVETPSDAPPATEGPDPVGVPDAGAEAGEEAPVVVETPSDAPPATEGPDPVGEPDAGTSRPYDCEAGYSNWQAGWSDDKKAWCCDNEQKGCSGTTTIVGEIEEVGEETWTWTACSPRGEDCTAASCCSGADDNCYMQNAKYGSCMLECDKTATDTKGWLCTKRY